MRGGAHASAQLCGGRTDDPAGEQHRGGRLVKDEEEKRTADEQRSLGF